VQIRVARFQQSYLLLVLRAIDGSALSVDSAALSVGTNLIHGEKCVILRHVSENMPNFTGKSRKEFEKFTENSRAPQTLFRGAVLMQTKKSVE